MLFMSRAYRLFFLKYRCYLFGAKKELIYLLFIVFKSVLLLFLDLLFVFEDILVYFTPLSSDVF